MRRLLAALTLGTLAAAACHRGATGSGTRAPSYEVFAVRFATINGFPKRSLIAGAPARDSLDIAMMVWVIRGGGHTVLLDAGFWREKFMRQWKPVNYVKPSESLAALGIRPEDVTDIIVSHIHWDHADGIDLFPRAKVWIQREEYEFYVTDDGKQKARAIDPEDAAMLHAVRTANRVNLVNGDAQEILPGIRVYTGGKHTFASQYVGVTTGGATFVLASDNAYLYENLERRRPIAQTLDSVSNVAAQGRMLELAGSLQRIIPGHDPQVFTRFPAAGSRAVRIH